MEYVDTWLVANYNPSWGKAQVAEMVQGATLEFLLDSINCDSTEAAIAIARAREIVVDYDNMHACVDSLGYSNIISSLEKEYLYRMVEFVYKDNLNNQDLMDSVNTFVCDVKNIDWDQSEVVCIAISSILMYSAEYSQSTWTFAPPPPATPGVFSLGDMIKWDVGGGVAGGLISGPGGILPGAGAASATYACYEVLDYFF
jgi:hypothetical protein